MNGWRMTLSCRGASVAIIAIAFAASCIVAPAVRAADKLLEETVELAGHVLFLESKVPGLVIGAIRNKETVVYGFGETAAGSGVTPNGTTVMRIGSLTKAFTGAVLASLAADGTVALSDPLEKHLDWARAARPPEAGTIRLIDLVTHASGLPREVDHAPGPSDDPFSTITEEAFIAGLRSGPSLFPPGTGILYSNYGFDLLAQALSEAAAHPYPALLEDRILGPLALTDTVFSLSADQRQRLMQGHGPDGQGLPDVPTGPMIVGSGGLYSTADDILRWLEWHLDRFDETDAETRLLDHAAYLHRDGLVPVFGMDESGRMDAMALGWVVMMARDDRPLILQKAGGLQGIFTYTAFAPAHGVGVFVAINAFDFSAARGMAEFANDLLGSLAPR